MRVLVCRVWYGLLSGVVGFFIGLWGGVIVLVRIQTGIQATTLGSFQGSSINYEYKRRGLTNVKELIEASGRDIPTILAYLKKGL